MPKEINSLPYSDDWGSLLDELTELPAEVPGEPLTHIALCFSGGGFRAASFSLGVLSYLNRVKYKDTTLLESVKYITSTSGGSITNGFFSSCLYQSVPFETFYQSLRTAMQGETLLKVVAATLTDRKQWTEYGEYIDSKGKKRKVYKERNLINAFAKTYDQLLFKGAVLGDIVKGPGDGKTPHLEETTFNTTEFNNGLAFYFQVNGQKKFVRYIGNGYLQFKETRLAERLKLSDVVAASSCFPGGFEPIRYPVDFVHAGNSDLDALLDGMSYNQNDPRFRDKILRKPFALMDGGIVDNMGLSAVLKADGYRRKAGQPPFDLILSCDVTSYFMDPLVEPVPSVDPKKGWFSLRWLVRGFMLCNLLLAASLFSILRPFYTVAGYLLLLPALAGTVLYWIGTFKLKSAKKDQTGTAAIALKYLKYFYRLPLRTLVPMIGRRAASVSKLVGDLFLKQIRRSQYEILFSMPAMRDRAIACLVYEFSDAFKVKRLEKLNSRDKGWWPGMEKTLMPTAPMVQYANNARSMGTTLWFTAADQERRDQLIATGQFTVCYSLIKHICRLETSHPGYSDNTALMALKKALLEDWELFKKDPAFMVG